MLFNSYEFILFFLPTTLTIFFFLNSRKLYTPSKYFLIIASLFFYSWWDITYLPLILFSIIFYLTFLLAAYVIYFNNSGHNIGEALSLGSMNRYFSVQLYFLVPVMLVETLKLDKLGKNDFPLILLVILVASYYFTKLFFLFLILAVFIMTFSRKPSREILNKISIFLTPFAFVTFLYSYSIVEKKIIPSDEYMRHAKRTKEIGKMLRDIDDEKTIIVWDNFDTYKRLAIEYYSDYQYGSYKIINSDEYKNLEASGKHLSSDSKIVFYGNKVE